MGSATLLRPSAIVLLRSLQPLLSRSVCSQCSKRLPYLLQTWYRPVLKLENSTRQLHVHSRNEVDTKAFLNLLLINSSECDRCNRWLSPETVPDTALGSARGNQVGEAKVFHGLAHVKTSRESDWKKSIFGAGYCHSSTLIFQETRKSAIYIYESCVDKVDFATFVKCELLSLWVVHRSVVVRELGTINTGH